MHRACSTVYESTPHLHWCEITFFFALGYDCYSNPCVLLRSANYSSFRYYYEQNKIKYSLKQPQVFW